MRIALLLALVACAEPVDDPEIVHAPPPVYEEELQGRWLLGRVPDLLSTGSEHVSVLRSATTASGQAVTIAVASGALVVRDASGSVLHAGADPAIVGLQLVSPDGVAVKVIATAVDADVGGPVYQLQYASGKGWLDYCADGEVAVPMQGTWTKTGFHRAGTNVSFGCRDGATLKCFTWGYVPGAPGSVAWDAHLACTRMARADVCGDGRPHTREETPIVIRDFLVGYHPSPDDAPALQHAPTFPAHPDRHFYESAWAAGENIGAVCLSRQRWASLPVDTCGPSSDPRTTPGVELCEDLSSEQLIARDALLANASKTQDMYMHRWRNPASSDVVTTVRGFPGDRLVIPFADYTEYLGSDGILLRNLPGSIADADVVEVFSTSTTVSATTIDRVLLPDAQLARTDPSFEGYLLKYAGADRVPFNEYQRGGVDRVTSVDPEDPQYAFVAPLYYAITP